MVYMDILTEPTSSNKQDQNYIDLVSNFVLATQA